MVRTRQTVGVFVCDTVSDYDTRERMHTSLVASKLCSLVVRARELHPRSTGTVFVNINRLFNRIAMALLRP